MTETNEADRQETAPQNTVPGRRVPALLISVIAHTLLLLILALLATESPFGIQTRFDFTATNAVDPAVESPQMQLASGLSPAPPTQVQPADTSTRSSQPNTLNSVSETLSVAHAEPTKEPMFNTAQSLQQILRATSSTASAAFASTGVDGRNPTRRLQLAKARGGSVQSEAAVERALEWLAAHQRPNGSWSLVHDTGDCDGRCRNAGSQERFDPAATGLALLAFLGAGYTQDAGKYQDTVRKGTYFLIQIMEETPQGGSLLYQSDRGMYNHGIAAFALCEAYQMTGDPDIKRTAQLAVDFIVSAQNYQGGWGYLPKQPGDLTLSGWQTMALKSAQAAELQVPASTIFRIDNFLETQQEPGSAYFGYTKPGQESHTCTAIGNLIRMFRGISNTDPRILESAQFLNQLGRSGTDIYFNYYASLYLFHIGDPFWSDWNPACREYLIRTQATGGHEAGSWYFENPYGKEGGRLYTTAMAAMTLEVYYRFSPLYQHAEDPFEL
ncbi:MAG: terpene cyclase/mutase family protein [Planctomycetales bacterium]|nr:terpene cyclase/mutase family protein [Planctomycetales bacterium]